MASTRNRYRNVAEVPTIPATRKKAIALLITAAGLGILLVAGVVLYRHRNHTSISDPHVVGAGEALMDIVRTTEEIDSEWLAIRALGHLRYKRAEPLLIQSLRDKHPYVRANAARALGDMRAISASGPLIELLENESDGGVIEQTSLALANIEAAEAIPALIDAANHDNVQTRAWVVQAIGRLGSRNEIPALAKYLDDPSPHVQIAAAKGIENIAGVDFGFPKGSGPRNSRPAGLRRARSWWYWQQREKTDYLPEK